MFDLCVLQTNVHSVLHNVFLNHLCIFWMLAFSSSVQSICVRIFFKERNMSQKVGSVLQKLLGTTEAQIEVAHLRDRRHVARELIYAITRPSTSVA